MVILMRQITKEFFMVGVFDVVSFFISHPASRVPEEERASSKG